MDNILDDDFKEVNLDESKINRQTSIIRYGICGFLGATEIKKIYLQVNEFQKNFDSGHLGMVKK